MSTINVLGLICIRWLIELSFGWNFVTLKRNSWTLKSGNTYERHKRTTFKLRDYFVRVYVMIKWSPSVSCVRPFLPYSARIGYITHADLGREPRGRIRKWIYTVSTQEYTYRGWQMKRVVSEFEPMAFSVLTNQKLQPRDFHFTSDGLNLRLLFTK